jgi:hypothetical protein
MFDGAIQCRGGGGRRAEVENVRARVARSRTAGGGGEVFGAVTRRVLVMRAYRTDTLWRTSPSRRSSMAWHSSHLRCPTRLAREGMNEPIVRASPPAGPDKDQGP